MNLKNYELAETATLHRLNDHTSRKREKITLDAHEFVTQLSEDNGDRNTSDTLNLVHENECIQQVHNSLCTIDKKTPTYRNTTRKCTQTFKTREYQKLGPHLRIFRPGFTIDRVGLQMKSCGVPAVPSELSSFIYLSLESGN